MNLKPNCENVVIEEGHLIEKLSEKPAGHATVIVLKKTITIREAYKKSGYIYWTFKDALYKVSQHKITCMN